MRLIMQTPPYIYQCSKCRNNDFGFMWKGNQLGIYCSKCGKWLKWADADERNLYELNKPVNLQPKIGYWVDDEFGSKCSYCGIYTHLDKFDRPMKFKYCSMCGAKMVKPQESEDKEC